MTRAALLAIGAGCAAAAIAGCGSGSDGAKEKPKQDPRKAAVTRVLEDLEEASRTGDGKRVCNTIFTVKLADSITRSARSGSCAREVRQNLFSPQTRFRVKSIDVADDSNATAVVTEQNGNASKVFFIKQAGQWRIRGVQAA